MRKYICAKKIESICIGNVSSKRPLLACPHSFANVLWKPLEIG